ncbi:5-oxoprolinase subunit PxpA [Maribacter sp. 2304DJ31-5]|uniref:5-oxoprolinase subunit PxpA n=1 Tax=Maribacter sp. 2304DJ31-5 TaxID=3386273 RepID=UPI0039BCB683
MEKRYVDINCDVGEGIGNEPQLFPLISSCNIACGGHAGDMRSMKQMLALTKEYKVKVGAHPSYPDMENFGRISMQIPKNQLIINIRTQIESLLDLCKKEEIGLHHIKPHGALYNDIAKDEKLADVFLEAIESYRSDVFLYVPFASVIAQLAMDNGFKIKWEAFGDRNYTRDLKLVPRKEHNALITHPDKVLKHLLSMLRDSQLITVDGELFQIKADTYCIHGDTPSAVEILTYLTEELPKYNYYPNP